MAVPWSDAPVHDAHVHFFTRTFLSVLGGQCGKTAAEVAEIAGWELPPQQAPELAARWTSELDSHGVARAALIASVPGDETSVRAAAQACPGRFYAYAMVNPLAAEAPDLTGLRGICLFPAMHGYGIGDARVAPLLERASAAGAVIFVHCGVLTVGIRRKLGLPSPFDMRWSNPIDLAPVAMRYPGTAFVIPHFGAGYFREALMAADLSPNIYLDTSSSNSWMRYEGLDLKAVFRRALNVVGPKRLLFGTDSSFFPRGWNEAVFQAQVEALRGLDISAPDARAILGANLARICGEF